MYKKFLAAALAVIMVLGPAGCGGSGGSTQTVLSQERESSAAPADFTRESTTAQVEGADAPAVIKVGFLTPLSSNSTTYGTQYKAAGQMIADVVNEGHPETVTALAKTAGAPTPNGTKIGLVFANSKRDPTTATSEVRCLIIEGEIAALTGQYASAITKAVAVVAKTHGIPLLTAGLPPSLTTPEAGLKWYFRFGPNNAYYIHDSFELTKQLNEEQDAGLMTAVLVSEDTEFGANVRIEEERMAEEYGVEVVKSITHSSSATSASSKVMKVKAANPNVIMMLSYASDVILYLKTFKEQNYVPKMLLGQYGGFVQTDSLDVMGKDTEFIYTTSEWSADVDINTSKQLIELYKQYTPSGADLNEDHYKDMISILLIALGISRAGTTEPETLNEAPRNLEVDTSTLPIPRSTIAMNEYGQNTSANVFVLQMWDGKYQAMYPSDYAAVEPVLPMPAWNERQGVIDYAEDAR